MSVRSTLPYPVEHSLIIDLCKKFRFSIIPLAYFTGQDSVMSIECIDEDNIPDSQIDVPVVRFKTDSLTIEPQKPLQGLSPLQTYYKNNGGRNGDKPVIRRVDPISTGDLAFAMFGRDSRSRLYSFANSKFIRIFSGLVVVIITAANAYAITQAVKAEE